MGRLVIFLNIDGYSNEDAKKQMWQVSDTFKNSGIKAIVVPVYNQPTEVINIDQPIMISDVEMKKELDDKYNKLNNILEQIKNK